MAATFDPQRRRLLKLGGALALTPFVGELGAASAFARPAGSFATSGATASDLVAAAMQWPTLSRTALWYSLPAADWQSQALPIGNGRLGAMLFADPDVDRIQFNEQSLWGGLNDYDNALAGRTATSTRA